RFDELLARTAFEIAERKHYDRGVFITEKRIVSVAAVGPPCLGADRLGRGILILHARPHLRQISLQRAYFMPELLERTHVRFQAPQLFFQIVRRRGAAAADSKPGAYPQQRRISINAHTTT